jgi:hypothetical protein
MATDETSTPAGRVARWRQEYGDQPWTLHDGQAAYAALMAVTTENTLAALADGAASEAQTWAALGSLHSYKYRRAI